VLTFLAGKAVVEVEGELMADGRQLALLNAKSKQSGGLFGGSGKGLLKLCAKSCAGKVAKQIISALKNS